MECRIRCGADTWIRIDDLTPESLFQRYLQTKATRCCDYQGGFFIDIDGQPWSDDSTVDEFWMTLGWFYRLKAILEGDTSPRLFIGPWEESNLQMRREGDALAMQDISPAGDVCMSPVRVPYVAFVEALLKNGLALRHLLLEVHRLAQSHESTTPEEQQVCDALQRHIPEMTIVTEAERLYRRAER